MDLRKDYRGQVELCEVQDESEDEGEAQGGRSRCVKPFNDFKTTRSDLFRVDRL